MQQLCEYTRFNFHIETLDEFKREIYNGECFKDRDVGKIMEILRKTRV